MKPGSIHIVTAGSNVWLDETTMTYLRLPVNEAPRDRPEWGDHRAGPLQDNVWHPMISWRIGPHPLHDWEGRCGHHLCTACPGLMIEYRLDKGGTDITWFPKARRA